MSIETVIKRIANLRKDTAPDSAKVQQALLRIGTTLESEIKLYIRRRGLIDTGRLLNSIHYRTKQTTAGGGVEVGSYGVPYAAFWEFGFRGIQNVRSSTRTSRLGKTYGVRAHTRLVNQDASRNYIRPALNRQRQYIINMIRSIGAPQ